MFYWLLIRSTGTKLKHLSLWLLKFDFTDFWSYFTSGKKSPIKQFDVFLPVLHPMQQNTPWISFCSSRIGNQIYWLHRQDTWKCYKANLTARLKDIKKIEPEKMMQKNNLLKPNPFLKCNNFIQSAVYISKATFSFIFFPYNSMQMNQKLCCFTRG